MDDKVSNLVVMQRIRNRVIEYLELAATPEDLKKYQTKAPVSVLNELIQQWNDWVELDNSTVYKSFHIPPYTSQEQLAIFEYNYILNLHDCASTYVELLKHFVCDSGFDRGNLEFFLMRHNSLRHVCQCFTKTRKYLRSL